MTLSPTTGACYGASMSTTLWIAGGIAFVLLSLLGYMTHDHWPDRSGRKPYDRNDYGES